jgi:hypothetical protein
VRPPDARQEPSERSMRGTPSEQEQERDTEGTWAGGPQGDTESRARGIGTHDTPPWKRGLDLGASRSHERGVNAGQAPRVEKAKG